MKNVILIPVAAIALVSALAAQKKTVEPPFDKAKIGDYLRHLELWPQQVQVQVGDPKPSPIPNLLEFNVHLSSGAASKDMTYYVTRDGHELVRGDIHDMRQNPFAHDLSDLRTTGLPSFGPANAAVTIIEFSDFECPLCREEARTIREKIPAEFAKDVRVVFHNYPLEPIHPWAKTAAIAGRCIFDQNPAAFWDYHDYVFEHQAEITSVDILKTKVKDWAKTKGLDVAQLEHCMDTPGSPAEAEIQREIAEGKKLDVDATPTMFLDGRRLVGDIPWQNLSQIIQIELDYLKSHK